MKKNKSRIFPHITRKNKLKMDQSLNVRHETIKILEKNISSSLFANHRSILGWVFFFGGGVGRGLSPKTKETKAKVNNTKLS